MNILQHLQKLENDTQLALLETYLVWKYCKPYDLSSPSPRLKASIQKATLTRAARLIYTNNWDRHTFIENDSEVDPSGWWLDAWQFYQDIARANDDEGQPVPCTQTEKEQLLYECIWIWEAIQEEHWIGTTVPLSFVTLVCSGWTPAVFEEQVNTQ